MSFSNFLYCADLVSILHMSRSDSIFFIKKSPTKEILIAMSEVCLRKEALPFIFFWLGVFLIEIFFDDFKQSLVEN